MKNLIALILLIKFSFCLAQSNTIKSLYIIDSIPMYNGFNHFGNDDITDDDVYSKIPKNDKGTLDRYKNYDIDEVIYIITKRYQKRADSIKNIPTRNTMKMQNDLFYLKESSVPYSGKYIDYYVDGNKQSEGYITSGLIDKLNKEYYRNGVIKKEYYFKNGKQIGEEKTFYRTGNISSTKAFKNNNFDGDWKLYYPNGQLSKISTFKKGKIIGESINYKSNGEVKSIEIYKSGIIKKINNLDKSGKLYNKAIVALRQRKLKEANEIFDEILSKNPRHIKSLKKKGEILTKQSKFDEAIKVFTTVIEIEPFDYEAYLSRALAYLETDKKEQKEQICSDIDKFLNYSTTINNNVRQIKIEFCK